MANTQAMTTSFKGELLTATHNFGVAPVRAATTADTFKAALYLTTATINAATTAYTATGEVTGTNYSAGGGAVTNGRANAGVELRLLDENEVALRGAPITRGYRNDPAHHWLRGIIAEVAAGKGVVRGEQVAGQ